MSTRTIMIYGSFRDPETKLNFFFVRVPVGRIPWSKKIAPAIHKLVKPMLENHETIYDWWPERIKDDISKTNVTRYLWDGEKLVKVAYELVKQETK